MLKTQCCSFPCLPSKYLSLSPSNNFL
uniref:Uncharacterized protein n=1 Tax=Arundo donax TaxID=35708 RepID=A0A0A9BI89_ARUDO